MKGGWMIPASFFDCPKGQSLALEFRPAQHIPPNCEIRTITVSAVIMKEVASMDKKNNTGFEI
ncbi:MAG: hypothetical protein IIY92_05045, partial [Lachnospiraceae bacterium]|nr:hypothetical protein [Lachnospiraceae bacterium]